MSPSPAMTRAWDILRVNGAPLALATGLLSLLWASLDQAGWLESTALAAGIYPAALLGGMLARSRFGGLFALAYSLVVLPAGAVQVAGRVVPGVEALRQGEWLWLLSARTFAFAERALGWAQTMGQGEDVADAGFRLLAGCLAAWGASTWLAWWVLRRRQAFAAVLPAGVLLGANVHFSIQPWWWLLPFVVSTVLLGASLASARSHADWDARGVDYPGGLALEWGTAAVALALGIGLLAAAAPYAATPEGWRKLADALRPARVLTVETGGWWSAGSAAEGTSQAAVPPDLSRIGAPIDQSSATVMWVAVSDPPPPQGMPAAALADITQPRQHYWRSSVFGAYTGQGWLEMPVEAIEATSDRPSARAGRYALTQQYELAAGSSGVLFAVNEPMSASEGALLAATAADGSRLLFGQADTYSVASWATGVSATELRAAPANYPPGFFEAYLQLPDSLPARVRDLAARITRGANNNYDKALRVQQYLRRTYPYELDVPAQPARDAVDYFLFEAPGGFCSHFASAMAVLLRVEGVPARVAAGYATGDFDQARGAWHVTASAAHAWVEVYFPGYGWVEFEPTPARAAFVYSGQADTRAAAAEPAGGATAATPGSTGWLVAAGAATALALAGWRLWRVLAPARSILAYSRVGGADLRMAARRLYHQERMALARAGLMGGTSVTPDEFLVDHRNALAAHMPLLAALVAATQLYDRAAYSHHPVCASELAHTRQLWAAAWRARLRLALRPIVRYGRIARTYEENAHGQS
jgi:hypothetical protein